MLRNNHKLFGLALCLLLQSCGGNVGFGLTVAFPDPSDEAKAATSALFMYSVVQETPDAACASLLAGTHVPGDDNYIKEDQESLLNPFTGKIEPLHISNRDSKTRLFFVEGEDFNNKPLFRGCTEVNSQSPHTVTVNLILVCLPNMADCDGKFSTGCESNLTSVGNCGKCGNVCANPNGQTSCSAGACLPVCAAGFSDCDGNPNNGCETDLTAPSGCNGHGECSFANNAMVCSCSIPYAGTHCDQCGAGYSGTYPNCYINSKSECLVSECFPVPPTGQATCYNGSTQVACDSLGAPPNCSQNYCGQDAQYAENRTFTCSGGPCGNAGVYSGEIITDSATGLMWQRMFALSQTQVQAANYCTGTYGGFSDWRLPNPFELHSIVDHDAADPKIDLIAFLGTPGGGGGAEGTNFFWTSTKDIANSSNAWAVRFSDGTTGMVKSISKTTTYYARCVRGGPNPTVGGDGSRFILIGGVALDLSTGLMWMGDQDSSCSDGGHPCPTWQAALALCEGSTFGGYTGWRLPNINELLSLADYGKTGTASFFTGVVTEVYWSSTTDSTYPGLAWDVNFTNGLLDNDNKSSTYHVACVRQGN